MGAAPSHDETPPPGARQSNRPSLGPRPNNTRHFAAGAPGDAAALPTAFFRDSGRLPRDHRPVEYRSPVQQSSIVRNVLSLGKQSLKLVQNENDPNVYLVEFEFDAMVEGFITIYYCAREVIQRMPGTRGTTAPVVRVSYTGKGDTLPGRTRFGAGKRQRYRQKPEKGLDVRQFTSQELRYRPDGDRYPVVIRLEAVYPPDSDFEENLRVKSQTTFATVEQVDGRYDIQVIAQQVLVGGTIYRMQDMYGIGGADVTVTKQPDAPERDESYTMDKSHECVICLTEPCNTAVLPCYHLCLCDDCARILYTETDSQRRKCPVCRTELKSILRIISSSNNGTSEEPREVDAGSTVQGSSTVAATVSQSDADGLSPENQPLDRIQRLAQRGEDCEPHVAVNLHPSPEGVAEGNTVRTPSATG